MNRPNPYSRAVGHHPARAALVGTLVVLLVGYLAFGSSHPGENRFEVRGLFSASPGLSKRAPVRIAGVDVGEVTKLERGPGQTALVTMKLDEQARPLYSTTSLRIRPRLFLEGGFYIQMSPGLPQGARKLDDGDTIPLGQTSVAVQSDQVLSKLDSQARAQSSEIVHELGIALDGDGAKSVRALTKDAPATLQVSAIAAHASLGVAPQELTKLLQRSSALASTLDEVTSSLERVTVDGNRTYRVFADHREGLRRTLRTLDAILTAAPATLTAVDRALPPLSRYARLARPVLARLPRALRSTAAVLDQAVGLTRDAELPRLLRNLTPTVNRLPTFEQRQIPLLGFVEPFADCVDERINPALETKLDDGKLSSGEPAWLEALHAATNISGIVGNFDGNGPWLRYESGSSDQTLSTGVIPGLGTMVGTAGGLLEGVRPQWNGSTPPPFHPEADCRAQKKPNLQATSAPIALKQNAIKPRSKAQRLKLGQKFRIDLRKAVR